MRYASEEAFWQLSVASTQFSDEVSTAILAAQTKDEAQFKHLAAVTEVLDAIATHVMAVTNEFVATKDAEIKVLQNSSTAMKADIAALRKEVKRKTKAADVKKQEMKLQEFFDAVIKKAKESANPIALMGELEGLTCSVKEGRSVKEAALLREKPSVKKGKAINSDPERPIPPIELDSGDDPAAPPLRPFRLELYDPDEDGEDVTNLVRHWTEFQRIKADLPYADNVYIARFRDGLHPEVKRHLVMSETPATVLVDYATAAIKTDSRLCNLGVIYHRPTTNPEARFHVHTKEPPATPPGDPMDLDATRRFKFARGMPNRFP